MSRTLTFAQAINEALAQALEEDPHVLCYGLGADDPKRIFGTTVGLQERFGAARVFDMPTAENALTGIAIGAAMNGLRPVMTHQRLDFFLLAMDQLVNNAAKWHYMFGGVQSIPITIRLIIGRGWGQGPTHSQDLQAWFAHIPGLKVVSPTSAAEAKGLLLSAIFDDNPVVFLEHRWLHALEGEVAEEPFRTPIGQARRRMEGGDITLTANSYMTIEALHACQFLREQGIDCDLIDLRSINPIDWPLIFDSVEKTGRLLALDSGSATGSVAGEVVARVAMERFSSLRAPPRRLALPDFPTPTGLSLTEGFYPGTHEIILAVGDMLGRPFNPSSFPDRGQHRHDVPGHWFKGPF